LSQFQIKRKDTNIHVTDFDIDSFRKFRCQLQSILESDAGYVQVTVNSYGGDVYNCLAMMNILDSLDIPVITVCEGYAMSAGAALLTCGDKGYRFAHPDSIIMLHEVSSVHGGSTQDLTNSLKHHEHLQKIMFDKMAKNIGKPAGSLQKFLAKKKESDVYLTAQEAQTLGIINHLKIPMIETVTSQHVEIL
jgi:ATP-dependent Clp protease protease subunit